MLQSPSMTRGANTPPHFHVEWDGRDAWRSPVQSPGEAGLPAQQGPAALSLFPIKIWISASMEIPESFWVTCFRAHPCTLGNIFMCNQQDPAFLHALSAGSEDSQALGHTLGLLILLPCWWDTPCLGLHTTAIFQSHFLGLHSHLCQPALSYQYNWLQIINHPVLSESKKKRKSKWITSFHLLPKSHNCVTSFPCKACPALTFLPLC